MGPYVCIVFQAKHNVAARLQQAILLAAHGKQRYAYRRDYATQWLGYSTDNGAYVRLRLSMSVSN